MYCSNWYHLDYKLILTAILLVKWIKLILWILGIFFRNNFRQWFSGCYEYSQQIRFEGKRHVHQPGYWFVRQLCRQQRKQVYFKSSHEIIFFFCIKIKNDWFLQKVDIKCLIWNLFKALLSNLKCTSKTHNHIALDSNI